MRRKKGEKILPPVRPNVGLDIAYRKRLQCLIEDMNRSVLYFVRASYKANPPAMMAMDETTAASQLRIAVNKLTRRWNSRFDDLSKDLAKYFAMAAHRRSDAALRSILRRGGMSVQFQMSPAMRDILKATIAENVSLIRSIPSQYFTQIQGAVMRSVTAGGDLATLTNELEYHYGVSRRRAAIIARSQNNLATSAMTRARQIELGLKATWMHSRGSRVPRPLHVKASGTQYDPAVGLPIGDKGQFVFPGQEPGCKCVSGSVVRGFT